MDKATMTRTILAAKGAKGLGWARIAEAAGLSEVYVTSACLGENVLSREEAGRVAALLDLATDVSQELTVIPMKAESGPAVPRDPLIYRFQEITYVYGRTLKELIEEKFGPGIMSAIDFTMDVENMVDAFASVDNGEMWQVTDPKGDRVKVVMNGKFLPYKKW
jgi:cyanate lyase